MSKQRKSYDYIKAVDDSLWHEPDGEYRHKVKRVLRKLVRDAARLTHYGDYVHGHGANIDADAIAKELIP